MPLCSSSTIALRDPLDSKHSYLMAELLLCCFRGGSLVVEGWALAGHALQPSSEYLQSSWVREEDFLRKQYLLHAYSQLGTFQHVMGFSALRFPRKACLPLTPASLQHKKMAGKHTLPGVSPALCIFLPESSYCKYSCIMFLHWA